MKKLSYLFLALLIVACSTDDNNNVDDTQVEWLYVHTAIEANATNSTTLVIPFTEDIFAFTDRPNREHKYISAEEFVSYWNDYENSFQFDPPNAVFTSVSDDGVAEVEVVITGASTDGDNITYTIQNPKLTENATFQDVSLFVDGNVENGPFSGQHYQGGIIFHILQPEDTGYVAGETHGLIAATEDHNGELSWDDAMSYCDGYTVGQYDDWHLPSKDELNQLYEVHTSIGYFEEDYYWSSTEDYDEGAWSQDFGNGLLYFTTMNKTYYVRAVRAF